MFFDISYSKNIKERERKKERSDVDIKMRRNQNGSFYYLGLYYIE
jgi:hypothetical protein